MEAQLINATMRSVAILGIVAATTTLQAQDVRTSYPKMAAISEYMMPQTAEIALARSAAPPSISSNAEVMVLGPNGYETVVKGTNGFVCLVERSWTGSSDDPDFWNPRLRAPICFNAAAVRSDVPITLLKSKVVLSTQSKAKMLSAVSDAFATKQLLPIESGAMCYMLSKEGYLSTRDGHWRPHLMFFTPLSKPTTWGAGLPGAPIVGFEAPDDHLSVFLVPVAKWSDGSVASTDGH